MRVLVKSIKTAKAEGSDPALAVKRRLLNFRNTPHPSTGIAPADLIFKRKIRSRIPTIQTNPPDFQLKAAKEKDSKTRKKRKEDFDAKRRTKEVDINIGDNVLIKTDKKYSSNPPFDTNHLTVTNKKKGQITMKRGRK